jgi:hypothetical protein
MSRLRVVFVLALAAGCDQEAATVLPCSSSGPGLHVQVDLSAGTCAQLSDPTNFGVQAEMGEYTVDKTKATMSWDPSTHHVTYVFDWAAGVGDGSPGRVDWVGNGDGAINGDAEATFTVQREACVTVDLTASCSTGVDAMPI